MPVDPPSPQSQRPRPTSVASKSKTTGRSSRSQPSPTRPITPGREHLKVAEFTLRAARRKAERLGIDLDIGDFPEYTATATEQEDPERPVRLLGHAAARIADRVPLLRKASRHLEGTETKSGLLSDLVAAAYDLYLRNSDEIDKLAYNYFTEIRDKTAARKAEQAAQGNGHVSRFRKAKSSPIQTAQNDNGGSF